MRLFFWQSEQPEEQAPVSSVVCDPLPSPLSRTESRRSSEFSTNHQFRQTPNTPIKNETQISAHELNIDSNDIDSNCPTDINNNDVQSIDQESASETFRLSNQKVEPKANLSKVLPDSSKPGLAEKEKDNEQLSKPAKIDSMLIPLSKKFVKLFILFLLVWGSGVFGFSFAWTLLVLILFFVRKVHKQRTNQQMQAGRLLAMDERAVIERALVQLPNWLYFPDAERVEWVNKIIGQFWPFFGQYTQKILRESVLPTLISYLPDYMKGLRFETIELGSVPLRIGSIKCHTERCSRKEVLLDLQIIYAGNSKFQLRCLKFAAGIKDVQLFGTLRLRLSPLSDLKPPFFGAITASLADVFDLPGLSELIRRAINEQLCAMLVYPNAWICNLSEMPIKQLRFQPPAGVLRLEVIEARQLKKADYGMLGLGKSDPYCRIFIAGSCFTTQVIYNTINPRWFFVCEAPLGELDNQEISIEVFDQDQGSSDDFLGRLYVRPDELDCAGQKDYWLPLEETDTGSLQLRLTWLELTTDLNALSMQLEWRRRLKLRYGRTMESLIKASQGAANKQAASGSSEKYEYPYGSIFVVLLYLDCVRHLPLLGSTRSEPSIYVNISLGCRRRRSATIENNCNPVFEQSFHLLCGPLTEESPLRFELMNAKTGKPIGSTAIDLQNLLQRSQLDFDQPIPVKVDQCGECILRVAIELRLLTNAIPNSSSGNDGSGNVATTFSSFSMPNDQFMSSFGNTETTTHNELSLESHTATENLDSAIVTGQEDRIPSLDLVMESTVQPFLRTMQYEMSDKELEKLLPEKNFPTSSQSNSIDSKHGSSAHQTALDESRNTKEKEEHPISPLRFQSVGFQMFCQYQPKALLTLENLNNIHFTPLNVTIHKIQNLHKVQSEKAFSRVKLSRYPCKGRKWKTKAIYNTNDPIFEESFVLKNSEKKPLSQLEICVYRGERKSFMFVPYTHNVKLCRVVINLTDILESKTTKWFDLQWNR